MAAGVCTSPGKGGRWGRVGKVIRNDFEEFSKLDGTRAKTCCCRCQPTNVVMDGEGVRVGARFLLSQETRARVSCWLWSNLVFYLRAVEAAAEKGGESWTEALSRCDLEALNISRFSIIGQFGTRQNKIY